MKKIILSLSLLGAVFLGAPQAIAGAGCSGCASKSSSYAKTGGSCSDKSGSYAKTAGGKTDIVSTAKSAGNFNTLVAAVNAADLKATLKSDGPFTVFAPTDEAFAKLPKGTLENLLKPENKDQLIAILTYHVVPGKVMAKDVQPGEVSTVNGSPATLAYKDGKLHIDSAEIIATDIETSNGVIHVIDTVILPNVKTAAL